MGYQEETSRSFGRRKTWAASASANLGPHLSFLSDWKATDRNSIDLDFLHRGEGSCRSLYSNLDDESPMFDVADELEKGLVDEPIVARTARAPVDKLKKDMQRCSILYKEQTDDYYLLSEAGDLLLVGQYMPREQRVDFYPESRQAEPSSPTSPSAGSSASRSDRRRPIFFMSWTESAAEWILMQTRCDHCAHRPRLQRCEFIGKGQQVARMRLSRRRVKDVPVHNMSVYVPPLVDGGNSSSTWCPVWAGKDIGTPSEKNAPSPSQRLSMAGRSTTSPSHFGTKLGGPVGGVAFPDEGAEALELQSILPKWDEEVDCLVLNFKGRSVISSARNFMMCSGGDKESEIIFQHAKMSNNMWCMDFRHPLSPVQAFGIAMSSLKWD